MILLDKILMGVIFLIVSVSVILMYRTTRKGPRLRGMQFWSVHFWNGVERLHNAYLSERKKREKDQRRLGR